MPLTETPDNPSQTPPREPAQVAPLKVRAGRYGELEQHELLQMLDAIDDERARGRFREAIYISIFFYLALTWFLFYGPRVLFHQGKIVMPADAIRQHEKELTYLDLPKDLSKLATPKPAKSAPPKARSTTARPQDAGADAGDAPRARGSQTTTAQLAGGAETAAGDPSAADACGAAPASDAETGSGASKPVAVAGNP